MKIIPVKVQNKLASVPCYIDDEDYFVLKNKKWCLGGGGKGTVNTHEAETPWLKASTRA